MKPENARAYARLFDAVAAGRTIECRKAGGHKYDVSPDRILKYDPQWLAVKPHELWHWLPKDACISPFGYETREECEHGRKDDGRAVCFVEVES